MKFLIFLYTSSLLVYADRRYADRYSVDKREDQGLTDSDFDFGDAIKNWDDDTIMFAIGEDPSDFDVVHDKVMN